MDNLFNPIIHWILMLLMAAAFTKWRRVVVVCLTLGYMTAIGFSPLPSQLLRNLEMQIAAAPVVPTAQAVVVFGGGTIYYQDGLDDYLTGPTFARALAAIRLVKKMSASVLIFSGFTAPGMRGAMTSEAESFRRLAIDFGILPEQIVIEDKATNTYENAKFTSAILEQRNISDFFLVTSSFHMKRAVDCFRRFNRPVLAHPTDYLVNHREQTWYRYEAWTNLRFFAIWLHETIGQFYYALRY